MLYLTIIGGAFVAWLILVTLFTPAIPYHIETPVDPRSDHFIRVVESTCHATLEHGNKVEVLTDGTAFYPAMLDAIHKARETVTMEAYIFKIGEIGDRFMDALAERARAGVRVTLLMDAIGSFGAFHRSAMKLREAGAQVEAYRRVKWYSLARLNNRTHRELLVVDGEVAFVGGAGVADWWWKSTAKATTNDRPMWRDMMVRIEGRIVSDIQGVVAENWLETKGEILTSPVIYKEHVPVGSSAAFAIKSSPADRATISRVLMQTLIEASTRRVRIMSPYFLPDKAFRAAFLRTATRGVEMMVIVPGPQTDQRWVRLASRRLYGDLLKAGVRIFEYQPGMTHVKALLVDDLWAVIGTTNLDNRSFEHNDEVNVAMRDEAVTARINADFERDLGKAKEITLDAWEHRPLWEKLIGAVAWILERQQ